MKKFLVLYRAPVSAREQIDSATPEQRQAGMEAWMAWGRHAGAALVDFGSPLGDAVTVGGGKRGSSDHAGGFSVLAADNLDEARRLLDGHPHLMVPGGSIELLEFLPTPGM